MKFSDALMCLKRGDKMRRLAWGDLRHIEIGADDEIHDFVDAIDAVPELWRPAQTDILADDWVQVE